jgi:serine/threonine protein kinase
MGMEFAKDGTLLDLIRNIQKTKKYLSDQNCSRIIKSILKGLQHMHRSDYMHRDLKPSNVVISDI